MTNALRLQIASLILGLLGWGSTIVATFLPSWRKSDNQDEVIVVVRRYSGLWITCAANATDTICDNYDAFFLGTPFTLQVARVLSCMSISFGLLGTIFLCLCIVLRAAFEANNCVMMLKMVCLIIAGIMYIICGATIGGAVSYFAANTKQYYYNLIIPQQSRFVYGEALYVGWVAMGISIIAGAALFFASCKSISEDSYRGYKYNPPDPQPSSDAYL